jgi:hypothetical protein
MAASASLAQTVARPALVSRQAVLSAVVLAGLCCWTVLAVGGQAGAFSRLGSAADLVAYGVPGVLFLFVLLSSRSPHLVKLALAWTATFAGALQGLEIVGGDPIYALAPAVVAGAAALALRWPVPTLVIALFLSGTYNTLKLYTPVEVGITMDLLLAGAWLALAYAYLSGRERPPAGMSPAFFLIGLFLAATVVEALLAENLSRSTFGLRASAWLMSILFLVPLWASTQRRREILFKSALVVGALVAAYAMLRWAIGPASKEKERVLDAATGFSTNELGEVKLLGSLPSAQALTFWSSAMFSFSLAAALSPIGSRWRALAAAVALMCGAAVFGADVRFGMVAAAAGGLAVLVLFASARGFAGRRVMPLAVVVVLGTLGGGLFVTTKLTAEGNSGARFRNLVTDPIADNSVQQRFVKWRTVLAEVEDKPFGKGVGASGAAEKKYARFSSAASLDPDSSYVKIAYDQGFVMVVLFAAAVLSLLVALALATLVLSNPYAAAAALGSCGALVAFIVAMSAGSHYEGLVAAGPWMLVAIGCTALVRNADPG